MELLEEFDDPDEFALAEEFEPALALLDALFDEFAELFVLPWPLLDELFEEDEAFELLLPAALLFPPTEELEDALHEELFDEAPPALEELLLAQAFELELFEALEAALLLLDAFTDEFEADELDDAPPGKVEVEDEFDDELELELPLALELLLELFDEFEEDEDDDEFC